MSKMKTKNKGITLITKLPLQTIETKFFGPTNFKGDRIKAMASGNKMVAWTSYDYGDTLTEHFAAAKKLADKLQWSGKMIAGATKTGYVFVFA